MRCQQAGLRGALIYAVDRRNGGAIMVADVLNRSLERCAVAHWCRRHRSSCRARQDRPIHRRRYCNQAEFVEPRSADDALDNRDFPTLWNAIGRPESRFPRTSRASA